MRFQPVKCNMMQITRKRIKTIHASYTLEGTVLENVENTKYLGITITNDLRWNTHVSNVCTKASRTHGFLRRNLYACPQEAHQSFVSCFFYLLGPGIQVSSQESKGPVSLNANIAYMCIPSQIICNCHSKLFDTFNVFEVSSL